jgi:hypothetical protein
VWRRRRKNLEKSPSNDISVVTSVALIKIASLRDKKHLAAAAARRSMEMSQPQPCGQWAMSAAEKSE